MACSELSAVTAVEEQACRLQQPGQLSASRAAAPTAEW